MSRLLAGLASAVLLAAPAAAHAQFNRNVIRDSGNGVNNTITVRNGQPIRLVAPQGPGFQAPAYQPPAYPDPGVQAGYPAYQAPVAPVGYPSPYAAAPNHAPLAGVLGFNRNYITNSGNGAGNAITVANRTGFAGGPGYDPSAPFPFGMGGFGVNVNVITNSGNGAGNVINTVNKTFGGPGGININVITNSGNGIGNRIGLRNR